MTMAQRRRLARLRQEALHALGIYSRALNNLRDRDGTRSAAAQTPVPQHCQARAESIAHPTPDQSEEHS